MSLILELLSKLKRFSRRFDPPAPIGGAELRCETDLSASVGPHGQTRGHGTLRHGGGLGVHQPQGQKAIKIFSCESNSRNSRPWSLLGLSVTLSMSSISISMSEQEIGGEAAGRHNNVINHHFKSLHSNIGSLN